MTIFLTELQKSSKPTAYSLPYIKVKLKSQCTCRATNARDPCTEIMMRIETIEKRKMPSSKYFQEIENNEI